MLISSTQNLVDSAPEANYAACGCSWHMLFSRLAPATIHMPRTQELTCRAKDRCPGIVVLPGIIYHDVAGRVINIWGQFRYNGAKKGSQCCFIFTIADHEGDRIALTKVIDHHDSHEVKVVLCGAMGAVKADHLVTAKLQHELSLCTGLHTQNKIQCNEIGKLSLSSTTCSLYSSTGFSAPMLLISSIQVSTDT